MSEMIERVAIAIAGGPIAWSEMWEEKLREEYRIDARAAIEAMIVDGTSANPNGRCMILGWEAMIDAALNTPDKPPA